MSDFLSRLAERALGAAPTLQPLLGSRYAPGAGSAEPEGFTEETVEREVPRIPAPPQALAPSRPRAAPALPAAADAHPAPSAPDRTAADPLSAPRAESAAIHRESTAPLIERDAEVPLVPVSTFASASPPAPPAAPAPVRGESHPSSAPPPGEPAMAARAEAPLVAADEGRPVDRIEPRQAASVASTSPIRVDPDVDMDGEELLMPRIDVAPPSSRGDVGIGEEDEGAGRAAAGRTARALPRPAALEIGGKEIPPAAPGEDAARPVVQVTIGRIEVRAVHPPAAPQPARDPGWTPPVLSLDEYLKRGSGR